MAAKKKTGKRKTKKYESPFGPIQDVIKAAKECRGLIAKEIITLELLPANRVNFRIDEEKYRLQKKSKQEDEKFRRLLRDEITKGLISALTGKVTDSFPPPQMFRVDPEKYKKEAEGIREKVGEILLTENIRAWHKIKNTAKNPVLESIDWEINTKKIERKLGLAEDIPHATVRFFISKVKDGTKLSPEPILSLFLPESYTRDQDSYVLDLHAVDIKNLIKELNRILDSLATVYPKK